MSPLSHVTRRDVLLVVFGALIFLLLSRISTGEFSTIHRLSRVETDSVHYPLNDWMDEKFSDPEPTSPFPLNRNPRLKPSRVLSHSAGWTLFENLYMSDGTLYIVTSPDEEPYTADTYTGMPMEGWESGWPSVRMMTSTGEWGYATAESIKNREPTDKDMSFISIEDAEARWGERAWKVEGNTWLFNDPNQFLGHYYHLIAELLFGSWAIFSGTLDPKISVFGETTAPAPDRAIFLRCTPEDIRDGPHLNMYVLKAAFPFMAVESSFDWADRVAMTKEGDHAWVFSRVLLTDRSASFRGKICGEQNQRIAAEAMHAVQGRLGKWWWEPVRRSVLRFAGVADKLINIPAYWENLDASPPLQHHDEEIPTTEPPVIITYISRQGGTRRMLIPEDHDLLVSSLEKLAQRKGWEFNLVEAQKLTKEEQFAMAAKTTVLVGVHGNGLSHLIMQALSPLTTVIEIFFPKGYAHDYEWTARALGFGYFAVWNDTAIGHPPFPIADYVEGFQGNAIPVYGPFVASIIEERIQSARDLMEYHKTLS